MGEPFSMQAAIQLTHEIKQMADSRFNQGAIEEFIETFNRISAGSKLIGSFLQISTDEGDELEIGFFTLSEITDITLSKEKVYFCTYPIKLVKNINIVDHGSKWVLSIVGEKKFDYNVVKPGSIEGLKKYKDDLQRYLVSFI